MLAVVVAIPLLMFPPVVDQVQSSCGIEPFHEPVDQRPLRGSGRYLIDATR